MNRKTQNHLYHKLFWGYSAVIVIIVGILISYSLSMTRRRVLETNQDYARKLCDEASLLVSNTAGDADYLHRALYQSSLELQDVLNYFQYDTEEYLRHHLDAYAESSLLDNRDILSYVENAYSVYPDMEQIEFISFENDKCTTFYSENDVKVEYDGEQKRQQLLRGGSENPGCFSFVKEIKDPQSMEAKGCIVYTFNVKDLAYIQEKYKAASLYLYYNDGVQVYPEDAGLLLEDFQQERADRKLNSYIQLQSVENYVIVTSLDKKMAAEIPKSHFFAILGIGGLLVLMGEFLISLYLKRLTDRMNRILEGMEQVQTGNLKVRLEANEKGDELDMISLHFNSMCQELEAYIKKSYLAEIEQKNARMLALQSQINPHFLYNTLEAIRMKAICNGDREVGKMLYSLAVTFRSQLKEADVITLMQELHYCKKYLELFEYRYQNKFTSTVECDPDLRDIPVIKFILQPVIENYFIHGIRLEETGNEIKITAEREGRDLYIHVTDNGYGMDRESIEKKNKELANNEMDTHKSIGITNVNRRLKAVYGEEYGVVLEAANPRGMHVILKIKMEEVKEDEKGNVS